ncbi:MAG: hypothetical protein WCP39_03485 [Chlamydiota bacterium]
MSRKKNISLYDVKNFLEDNHHCYVLLTCSPPSAEGKMQVHLDYSGDEVIVSYLIDSAQNILEQEQSLSNICKT